MQSQSADGAQHDVLDRNPAVEFKDILQAQRAISRECYLISLLHFSPTMFLSLYFSIGEALLSFIKRRDR